MRTRREQAHSGRVAENENAADVITEHRDAERRPESIDCDEEGERGAGDDAGIPHDSSPPAAELAQDSASRERHAGFRKRQRESGGARRAGSGRAVAVLHGTPTFGRIGKALEEFAQRAFSVETDGLGVRAKERSAKD